MNPVPPRLHERLHDHRYPEIRAFSTLTPKSGFCYTDDGHRGVIQSNTRPENIEATGEAPLPIVVADNCVGVASDAGTVGLLEDTPNYGLDTQQ